MVGPARCAPGDPLKGLGARGDRRRALGALLAHLSPPSLWWSQVGVKHVRIARLGGYTRSDSGAAGGIRDPKTLVSETVAVGLLPALALLGYTCGNYTE